MSDAFKKPLVIDWEEAADPAAAPPVPDGPGEMSADGRMLAAMDRVARPRGTTLGRLTRWVFLTLGGFVLSVAAYDFVTGLLARDSLIGWIAFGLVGLALALAAAMALREWNAYLRLARLEHVRVAATTARETADLNAARGVVAAMEGLYAARADLSWGRSRLAEGRAGVFDADALLNLAEVELLGPLDQAARREIEGAARQVATVTALVPLALADVAMALYANLRMVRRLAELYGGRSGALGSWGLMRRVFAYLIATGAVAIGDDLIGSFAGGGILSKVSRRFGEGVVNGALTARVGLAAMELCRPMPFAALPRPKVSNLVSRGLAGMFGGRGDEGEGR